MSLLTLKDPFASDFPSFLEESLQAPLAFRALPPPPQPDGPPKRGRKRVRKDALPYEVSLCATFSGAGSYVTTGMMRSGFVAVRDLMTRHVLLAQQCHEDSVNSVAYVPQQRSKLLVTCSSNGEFAIFDMDGFKCRIRWRQALPVMRATVSKPLEPAEEMHVDAQESEQHNNEKASNDLDPKVKDTENSESKEDDFEIGKSKNEDSKNEDVKMEDSEKGELKNEDSKNEASKNEGEKLEDSRNIDVTADGKPSSTGVATTNASENNPKGELEKKLKEVVEIPNSSSASSSSPKEGPASQKVLAPGGQFVLLCRALPSPQEDKEAADNTEGSKLFASSVPWPLLAHVDLKSMKLGEFKELSWPLEAGDKAPKAMVAAFSAEGDYVYVGGAGGAVHIFSTRTGRLVGTERPLAHAKRSGWIKRIVSSKARIVLAQTSDKVIHMIRADGPKLMHVQDFQDSVENIKWACCDVSPDGEYIIAGCANGHVLHVWNVLGRHMAKLMAPDRGLVRQVLWHPRRPIVLSLGRDGQVLVWATHRSESWTAFAPNFVELEENESYHEREDEFDRNPREDDASALANAANRGRPSEDDPVDLVSVQRDADDLESDEFVLPLRIDE